MRRALPLAVLVTGCTSVFGGPPPVGCDTEDADGDGFLSEACLGVGNDLADCDDDDPDVFPGAPEVCNGRDDNCDGAFDEGLAPVEAFADCDGDGAGGEPAPFAACAAALLPTPPCASGGSWIETGGDCDDLDPDRQASCGACGSVDLLFVLDNDTSSAALHAQLAAAIPLLIRPLATGDLDGDGAADTEPIASLQVGMVTGDMGSRGFVNPGCSEPELGDDGVLITTPAACMDRVPPYSVLDPMGDVGDFVGDALCHVAAGDLGCLYQQPLEAGLRGLTPGSSLLRFHPEPMGLGHGDFANTGFLREDSILAITTLTDVDDCSVAPGHEDLFDPLGGADFPPGHGRCDLSPDFLQLVERYVSGLLALRSGDDLVFGLLAGVPPDLAVTRPDLADYLALERDPRMTPRPDPMNNGVILPSCVSSDMSVSATPPARLARVARGLAERGASTVLGSVCDPAPEALAQALVAAVLEARDRRCGAD